MSRSLGILRQAGYVVSDLEQSIKYWTEDIGIGPFFVIRQLKVDADYLYRGQPSPSPTLSVALAFSGGMQIELIQQHDEHPSPYRDFLRSGRAGFHHWSSWLTPAEYDKVVADRLIRKTPIAHQGTLMGGSVRFIYWDTENTDGGMMFEIADLVGSDLGGMMHSFETAAKNWDGSDPVREVG
ncbi:MAG: VOC family protein [Proteobacteria bacterium]|nr:VOC family protein [Pseudomonadota bacterium]